MSEQNEKMETLEDLVKRHLTRDSSPTTVNTNSLESGPAERQTSPELRSLAGGNPTRSDNQTLPMQQGNPDRFENWSRPANFGRIRPKPEDQLPFWMLKKEKDAYIAETSQPELRNQAGGKPPLQAESGTQKPNLFEYSSKGPIPVYKMDRGTYCPDGPAQVPL